MGKGGDWQQELQHTFTGVSRFLTQKPKQASIELNLQKYAFKQPRISAYIQQCGIQGIATEEHAFHKAHLSKPHGV